MKKILCILLCCVSVFGLCSCGDKKDNTKNMETKEVASDRYSEEDINSAITTITEEFEKDWKGCTLTEIYYAGDECSADYQEWATRNDADEVIVLLSSFDVDSSGGDGSLDANSTYENWNWILVRENGGQWRHVDHGY